MISLAFIAAGLALGWLAMDCWQLRGSSTLPSEVFLRTLYRDPPNHINLQEQARLQRHFYRAYIKFNANQLVALYGLGSIGCFAASAYTFFAQ